MKSKVRELLKTAVICLAAILGGLLLCWGIFYFVDHAWNGMFADWFMKNYAEYQTFYGENEVSVLNTDWFRIKRLIFGVMCINIIFWILVIFVIVHFYGKAKVKKTITMVSGEIHDYMQGTDTAADSLPKEHAEIAAQLVSLKTTMQKHEQLLKEEAARKNDLIAYLAHDLKTPLTSIIGYLSLLDEAPDLPMEQRIKYTGITLDKAKRLEKLINEFFEITRYNLQQIVLEKEPIDLYYMLVQMTDEFYPILQPHGNTVELCVEENLTVYGDSMKLARVFNNILKNAVAYSYPDTPIRIWSECTEHDLLLYFRNKGRTIPAYKLDNIFEKFFRLDEARATNTGGAGLGLAIAREIAELHGGTITAESENEMTTFCVKLPVRS